MVEEGQEKAWYIFGPQRGAGQRAAGRRLHRDSDVLLADTVFQQANALTDLGLQIDGAPSRLRACPGPAASQ